MTGVRGALMRGGTSKGVVLLADDVPADAAARDDLLLRLLGSPDPRQLDGVGGAHPLTSKVAIVGPSPDTAADVDYLFVQVLPGQATVSTSQTCGNMLAAVAPFAVLRGLVPATGDRTTVRVRLVNTGAVAAVTVATPDGVVTFDGDAAIPGVPGTAAPVLVSLATPDGPLLPSGRLREQVAGVDATLVDAGLPTVIVHAADLGVDGGEPPEALEADDALTARVAAIRAEAFVRMGLPGALDQATTPKVVLVSPPAAGGALRTRSFIPHRVHEAIGVLCAVGVAAAARLPGTVAADVVAPTSDASVRIEHPTGTFDAFVAITAAPQATLREARIVRTARLLMDGMIYPRPR